MADRSKIEWTDSSWTPLRGVKGHWHCTKVSAGCEQCYAERFNVRLGGPAYKHGADTFRLDEKILSQPLRWKTPRKVFVCSMTDLFHEDVDFYKLQAIFQVMVATPHHTYQVLTKRASRMKALVPDIFASLFGKRIRMGVGDKQLVEHVNSYQVPPNIWLGVSVEDQATADERIPLLLQTPAAVRFVSYEPALGPVNFSDYLSQNGKVFHRGGYTDALDWVICGGESGPKARPMHPDWARGLRDQCQAARVPYFFKQWGEWRPRTDADPKRLMDQFIKDTFFSRIGKKRAGRLLDGRTWDEFPDGVAA